MEQPERVLITGGTSGIGLATARRYARRGARVAVLARGRAGLERAAGDIARAGGEPLTLSCDVTDRPALRSAVEEAVSGLGGLDVAVANVGASAYGEFIETSPEDFDRVVDVTFRGNVNTVREVLPHLTVSRGRLVLVGSVAADLPLPLMSAYTAAKHALRGFSEALRAELRAQGSPVSLSLVEPGPVDSPFWDHVASADAKRPALIPLSYHPDEVARAIEQAADSGRPRSTVGAAMVGIRMAQRWARPVTERLLGQAARALVRLEREGPGEAAIWQPTGAGQVSSGAIPRPSALVRVRGWLPHA
jgi:NAD(P)-dependent dehydrogenase (short-subunit alcohol dehydrogenase family)